jgi:RNA polymerase sigma-70 factor (ECF subfamily)
MQGKSDVKTKGSKLTDMSESEIEQLIKECLAQNRNAQRTFYEIFYGFAMGICLRYASNRYEAAEIMNKGFENVFTCLNAYNYRYTFKAWLGKIMVNASIDYYHDALKMTLTEDCDAEDFLINEVDPERRLSSNDLLAIIQQLCPCYRIIFSLFAIEGHSHEEIAKMLNIDPSTSESVLCKARIQLMEIILGVN